MGLRVLSEQVRFTKITHPQSPSRTLFPRNHITKYKYSSTEGLYESFPVHPYYSTSRILWVAAPRSLFREPSFALSFHPPPRSPAQIVRTPKPFFLPFYERGYHGR